MGIRQPGRWAGRLIGGAAALWLAGLVAICLWTAAWPMAAPLPQGDAILCLGAGVDAEGRIDPASRTRAGRCAELARAGAAPVLVMTGGPLRAGTPTAADGMADVARAAGTGDATILLEDRSHSTLQNALFSLRLVAPDARLILVTEAFHLPRAWISFRAMGAQDLVLYPSERLRRTARGRPAWHMLLRESLALWFNAGRLGAWWLGGMAGIPEDRRAVWLK